MRTRIFGDTNNTSKPNLTETQNPFQSERDLMNSLYNDKQNIHQSQFLKFSGTSTVVTYFNRVFTSNDGNMQNSTSTSTVSKEIQYFDQINNFEVKIEDAINISNEGDDVAKNYIRSGSLKILPGTIVPYVGDLFIMKYLDSDWLFQITSVNKESYEMNSAFVCEFIVENNGQEFDYETWLIKDKIRRKLDFYAAHLGTDYKTILEENDGKELELFKKFYNYIGEMYYNLFYDKVINVYLLKNIYVKNPYVDQDLDHRVNENFRYCDDAIYYDNFLQFFIKENNIFSNINGIITIPSVLVEFSGYDYYRTIFHALSNQTKDNLKYKYFSSNHINNPNTFIPTILYGMEYIKHVSYVEDSQINMLPNDFYQIVDNFQFFNLQSFDKSVYSSDTYIFIEIISLYLVELDENSSRDRFKEISKRIEYLFNRKHMLNVDNILPQYIYYLYPILGFIINKLLNTKYNISK